MTAYRRAAVTVAVVGLSLLGWVGYRAANATAVYTYRVDFVTLPESDDALREWLASQPAVPASSVSRDGQTVVGEYVRSRYSRQPLTTRSGRLRRTTANFGKAAGLSTRPGGQELV